MDREVAKLIQDIFDSITIIETHLQNIQTLSAYKKNITVIDAVERRLAIIGEALWKADKLDQTLIVSDKKRIISLRHILIHDYNLIEHASIWTICKKYLPILKREIEAILNSK